MMKLKSLILILIAGGSLLTACQKNIDIFVPDPGQLNNPDTSWQGSITASMPVSILKNNLLFEPYEDSIMVNANVASVLTPFGVQLNFTPNSCVTASGQPITGRVKVELMLIKKKGDMIRMNKPTTNNDSLLVSAGQIFINLTKEGQPVKLAPNAKINIHYVDLPTNPAMKFFVGDETNTQLFNWLPNPDLTNNIIVANTQAYEIYTNHLRWCSAAYLYDFSGTTKVNISVDLASYFTNTNTVAFTVLKDFRSVVSMYGDLNTRKFISSKVPVGKAITVVVISKQGNDYFLGYESTVALASTTGNTNHSVTVTPVKRSIPEILSYLSTL